MEKNKKVTLKDVADSLGVSKTLVSFVLNGKAKQYKISEEMSLRVMATARDMNYSPNMVARNLRGGKTQLIGLIVTDISNPFFSLISRMIENRANELNYTVVYGSSDENCKTIKKLVNVFLNKGVDGLIIVPCTGSEKIVEELYKKEIPVVLIDRFFPGLEVSFSCLDNIKATEVATQHLIDQGFKNISLVAYKSDMNNDLDRITGYENSMRMAGYSDFINAKKIDISNPKLEVNKALEDLVYNIKTEAVIFSTNMLCVHGLNCLNEMNVKVPDDVAIVGFDGNDVFDFFYSPITYIKQPVDQIAERAVNILVDKIENSENFHQSMEVFEPELVIKKSSIKSSKEML